MERGLDLLYSLVLGLFLGVLFLTGALGVQNASAQYGGDCCDSYVYCPSAAPCIDGTWPNCNICTSCCIAVLEP